MLFNEDVIRKKNAALEKMSRRNMQDLVTDLTRVFPDIRNVQLAKRPWTPGGGSILLTATVGSESVFIKMKDKTLGIESRLEKEDMPSSKSALESEAMFCRMLAGDPCMPVLRAFREDGEYAYEVFEQLLPFEVGVEALDAYERYQAFRDIEAMVRRLYDKGIVHTDVHEKNILFRGKQAVLCDFEEARLFVQDVPFEQSLDVVGENAYGNVGQFPEGYGLPGLTCLKRLRLVFKPLIKAVLPALLEKCHFSNDCQFNVDELQDKDERIYQSIDLGDSKYAGQRPLEDKRHDILVSLLDVLGHKLGNNLSVVDIGSNLGTISFAAARSPFVSKVTGLEAFTEYAQVARVLTLLLDYDSVTFEVNQAGVDPLPSGPLDVLLLFSVYHHVRNKDGFLKELAAHRPKVIIAEMAVQERYYQERGGKLEDELRHIGISLGYQTAQVIGKTPDYGRPICVFHDMPPFPVEMMHVVMQGKSPFAETTQAQTSQPQISQTQVAQSRVAPPQVSQLQPVKLHAVQLEGVKSASAPLSYEVKVSIVLPTYNHAQFLPAALQSILNQTFTDFELIVVNDGSTDQTAAMLAGINHPKLRVVTKDNGGLPAALNSGFDVARGEYWTWTSADNLVAPTWLEELVGTLDRCPRDVGYVFSSFALINDNGQVLSVNEDQSFDTYRMLYHNGNASFLYRAELAKQVGPYDVALNGAEDLDMWFRMSLITRAVHIKSVLYYYRLHDDTMTQRIPDKVRKATEGAIEKLIVALGGKLDIDRLFPSVAQSSNPALARWQAKIWLAGRMMATPFCPVKAVVDMLVAALLEQYEVALVINIVHLFASRNAWDAAAEVVKVCQQTDASATLRNLAGIVQAKNMAELTKIPFTSIPDQDLVFNPKTQISRTELTKSA